MFILRLSRLRLFQPSLLEKFKYQYISKQVAFLIILLKEILQTLIQKRLINRKNMFILKLSRLRLFLA